MRDDDSMKKLILGILLSTNLLLLAQIGPRRGYAAPYGPYVVHRGRGAGPGWGGVIGAGVAGLAVGVWLDRANNSRSNAVERAQDRNDVLRLNIERIALQKEYDEALAVANAAKKARK